MLKIYSININHVGCVAALSVLGLSATNIFADGVYRNGIGARSMAMGGADVGYAADPLGAMAVNPAGLGFLTAPELDLSGNISSAFGHFDQAGGGAHINNDPGVYPDAAFAYPLGKSGVTLGLAFITDSALDSDWHYNDATYGNQRDRSEFTLFRSALGAGYQINSQWSIGASAGLLYNQNRLTAPYTFQNASSGVAGAKVLLDLRTSGTGYNASAGVLYRPTEKLEFGLSYKSPTTIFTDGDANGALGATPYHFDAYVKNVLPQVASIGGSWKFADQWRLALQVDWINWGGTFTSLPVRLQNGTIPGLATINDSVPLDWKNEFVYRAGLEYNPTERWVVRAGYCFGESPVPNSTLTPMTATITEHTLTAGVGYHWSRYTIDAAYQFDIPATRDIGTSALLNGDYSNTSVSVGIQTLTVSTGIRF